MTEQPMNYQGIPVELGEPEHDDETGTVHVPLALDLDKWKENLATLQKLKQDERQQ